MAAKKKVTAESTAEVLTAAVETEAAEQKTAAVEAETETAAVEAETAGEDSQTVKAVVKSVFRDKNNGRVYHVGDVIEVTAERLAEINSGKLRAKKI